MDWVECNIQGVPVIVQVISRLAKRAVWGQFKNTTKLLSEMYDIRSNNKIWGKEVFEGLFLVIN